MRGEDGLRPSKLSSGFCGGCEQDQSHSAKSRGGAHDNSQERGSKIRKRDGDSCKHTRRNEAWRTKGRARFFHELLIRSNELGPDRNDSGKVSRLGLKNNKPGITHNTRGFQRSVLRMSRGGPSGIDFREGHGELNGRRVFPRVTVDSRKHADG